MQRLLVGDFCHVQDRVEGQCAFLVLPTLRTHLVAQIAYQPMERTESEGPTRGGVSGAAGISVELPFPSFSSPPTPGSGGGRSGVFMVKVGSREQRPAYF